jgi:tetratricopeptide (TPR) repeat protein
MDKTSNKYRFVGICLVLALATAAVYWQVNSNSFVNYDDPIYVYQNPNIQAGITPETIKWAFTAGYAGNWHPLTWLSHMLDWQLFGSNPAGHHITNLIFHIVNTLLLFFVLKQMTSALWQSAFAAALFALHPLHVESVAWVAERKDVLSTLFWMLTMWAYLRYVKQPKIISYLLIVVFFGLGLMSKPMLVSLPFVLLLLDYWPFERFGQRRRILLVMEKIPLFIMVLASCIVTFIVQRKAGAMTEGENYSLLVRLANASISYLQYIIKMVWPVRLAMFYPHPGRNVSFLYAAVSAVLLSAVTILVLRFSKNRKYLVTGWFWYLGTLVPVIGIVQVGYHAFSDRYSYITLTGLFIIVGWGLPELLEKLRYRKIILWTSSLIVLATLATCSYFQQQYWKNSITLCQHALAVTDNNYQAHFCMTEMLCEQGRIEEAIQHNTEAVRIKPDFVEALNGLGNALYIAGRTEDAIRCYERALEIRPGLAQAHANIGIILVSKGKFAEAARHYKIAARVMNTPQIHSDFGYALLNLGQFHEAIIEYRKVLSARANDPDVLNKIGYALAHIGNLDEAIAYFDQAIKIDPDYTDAKNNLALVLAEKQKLQNAKDPKK